jgi:hypothetical protein
MMDVFAITPASSKPLWFIAVAGVILAIVLIALAYTAYSSRNSRVEIGNDHIRLVGDFWGREIPFQLINIADARILDLHKQSDLAPRRRTFGTGLPGYAAGWFKLRNGEKALVYLSRSTDVAYVPTTDGYSLLLSVDNPHMFIDTLERRLR